MEIEYELGDKVFDIVESETKMSETKMSEEEFKEQSNYIYWEKPNGIHIRTNKREANIEKAISLDWKQIKQ